MKFLTEHAEILGLVAFALTFVGTFVFGWMCRKFNLLGNISGGYSTRPVHSEVETELAMQTKIMQREYNDRISGYRQNYKKWD